MTGSEAPAPQPGRPRQRFRRELLLRTTFTLALLAFLVARIDVADVGRAMVAASPAWLILSFASLSLLLGAVGIYGVTSFVVSQRGHEIGIRKALGARAGEVVGLIMVQGMVPIAAGLILGLLGAAAGGRIMQSLLFQVDAQDPFTYGVVAGVLALVGLGASWLPARRAAKIDPMRALRSE